MSRRVATPLSDVLPAAALVEGASLGSLGAAAQAVVAPGNVQEVRTVLEWASGAGVRVVAVGTGRHLGSPVGPDEPLIVLSTARLDAVEIYEPADLTLTAGAGLGVAAALATTRPQTQWLPFDPPDFPGRTLGGLVAVGRTGPTWAGYGELRNHVLGATVVCGDGRVLKLGGRVVKNVAGFDLLRPVVGSRGALGVITSVTVRLFPLPALDRLLVLEATDYGALLPAARAVATASVLPVSIVLARVGGRWALYIRVHGAPETLTADQKTLEMSVGAPLRALDGADTEEGVRAVRDAGVGLPEHVLHGLPTGLGERLAVVVRAVDSLAPIVADVYRGTVRWYADAPSSIDDRVADPATADLERGVRAVFDPGGVLWSPQ